MFITNDHFPNPLVLAEIGDAKWILMCDYIFIDEERGINIKVPKGFTTDLYSIPKFARSIVSRVNAQGPAVVHDYLFNTVYYGSDGLKQANEVLNLAMQRHWAPVSRMNRALIMAGLRCGSKAVYKRKVKNFSKLLGPDGRRPPQEQIDKLITRTIDEDTMRLLCGT